MRRRSDDRFAGVGWALRALACRCAAAPVEQGPKSSTALGEKTKRPHKGAFSFSGGEGGIRTLGTLLTYTHFPGGHLKPLSHLSENVVAVQSPDA